MIYCTLSTLILILEAAPVWQIAFILIIIVFLVLIPKREIEVIEIIDDDEDLDELEEWAIIEEEEEDY